VHDSGVTAKPKVVLPTGRTALLLLGFFALSFGAAWVIMSPGPLFERRDDVPQVVGLLVGDASERLRSRRLRTTTRDEPAIGSERAGVVLRQDPMSGTAVPPGFTVQLYVSTGRSLATMPDVIGFPLTLARQVVTAAGLRVGAVDSVVGLPNAAGLILVTRPGAGTTRTAGDKVDLIVSRLP